MTVCTNSHTENGYYVTMEIERRYNHDVYVVKVCPCIDEFRCGYPIKEITYPINDQKKAYATYKRYINKYCKTDR